MEPDMMALAKGLSSSYFPISAVVIAPRIYDAVYDFNKQGGSFGHGFTNSGHPVGVAVALEAIKIYEEMDLVAHVRRMGARLRALSKRWARPRRLSARCAAPGLMLGIEIVADKETRARRSRPSSRPARPSTVSPMTTV